MKSFDSSILLPLSGALLLVVGKQLKLEPFLLAAMLALLLFAMFVTALIRFSKVRALQLENAKLVNDIAEKETELKRELAAVKENQKKEQAKFFSDIAHSLRMPVSIVQGYAELLQSGTLDFTTESEYIDKILQHTYRMTDILSGKLDDQTEGTAHKVRVNRVELIALVEQQLDDMRTAAEEKGVSLQAVYSDDEIFVDADFRQLQRIFSNLVENSLKYMAREGMVTVLLSKQGGDAHITVRDDGMGLPDEEAKRIFDEGYRGSNSKNAKGSGYGLYMIKQSVEAQHGSISASSQLGRGMTVSFTLPLAEETEPIST